MVANSFVEWFNDRGVGKNYYVINKEFNKGPFTSRKDHIVYTAISDFEIMEYDK
ncbi:galactose oxidase [Brevibacillus brevis X23]|nr:galactose oxidase [Brevibacillus brevis X23]